MKRLETQWGLAFEAPLTTGPRMAVKASLTPSLETKTGCI
jgi:hypothetical protein